MKKIAADVKIGNETIIYDFVNLYGCEIGNHCKIGTFVEIQRGVKVGNNCKISSHSFLCEGVELEDGVFIGHGVMFTNDRYPRSTRSDGTLQTNADWKLERTLIQAGASIGSNVTILCGVTIGAGAMIGAGSVVTKDIPTGAVAVGNPARVIKP